MEMDQGPVFRGLMAPNHAGIAQAVERALRKRQASGSTPDTGTIRGIRPSYKIVQGYPIEIRKGNQNER